MRGRILSWTALLLACAAHGREPGACLVDEAREQIGVTVIYDPAYRRIAFPGGDVPADRGVCTDVLIRAYRQLGVDLQKRVHEDMRAAWSRYPKLWGLSRTDTNIDHRRVPNLAVFFSRHGVALDAPADPLTYQPGDIVTWRLPAGVPHIGIVSDKKTAAGVPLVSHNIGSGTVEENVLLKYTIIGRYRYTPTEMTRACATDAPPSRFDD
jgi:uncharacterized protein YijF (DUF1287 family)